MEQHPIFKTTDENFKRVLDAIDDTGIRVTVKDAIRGIAKLESDFRTEEMRLLNDRSLSAEGKSEGMLAARLKFTKSLEAIEQKQQYYVDRVQEILAGIPDNEYGDPVLNQLICAEHRQQLEGGNWGLTDAQYLADISKGDTPLIRAMESSPIPRECVTDETRAISRLARLVKSDPAKYQAIQDLNGAVDTLAAYTRAAEVVIQSSARA